MAKFIGSVLLDIKKYLNEKYGERAFVQLLQESETTKELSQGIILATEWYDLEIYNEILRLLKEKYPEDFKKIQCAMAEKQLKGVMGMLAKFVSLQKILEGAQNKWNKFYTDGKLAVEKKSEEEYLIKISELEIKDVFVEALQHYLDKLAEIATGKTPSSTMKKTSNTTAEYQVSF